MTTKPQLIILAGPNGSGKTTFYELTNLLFSKGATTPSLPFVNPDLIAAKLANNEGVSSVNDLPPKLKASIEIQAGRFTLNERKKLLQSKTSFVMETTASSKSILDLIDQAKGYGFVVRTYFFLLKDSDLNNYRIENRTKKGLHFVAPEIVERRYLRAKELIADICLHSDHFALFDSGCELAKLIDKRDGKVFIFDIRTENSDLLKLVSAKLVAKGIAIPH